MLRKILLVFLAAVVFLAPGDLLAKVGNYSGYRLPSYNSYGSSVRVRGYTRKSTGTFVLPHRRTFPDATRYNNWSTKGNTNSYTEKRGTKKYW